jgi:RND family efflux transporter MFP subunit
MNVKQLAGIALLVVAALALGWWIRGPLSPPHSVGDSAATARSSDGPCPGGAEPLYWKAPMDPTYVRDKPGKSPMGMDLVPACPSAGAAPAEGSIRIDPGMVQNIGVRTAPVERRDLSRAIRALGRVAYDERRVAHVHTKVQGWAEKLWIEYVGQEVRRGQPLLEIYSPELVATQEELLLASRYRDATDESPFEDVSRGGKALFEAARRRMELWDVAERDIERLLESGEIEKTLTLYAPTSGVVTKLGVRSGMEVRPNDNLYTIADLSKVWVLSNVYEYELPWIELGLHGTVQLSYLPGRRFEGTVTYISPFLDPKTRTAEVRLELDNADRTLRPEMFGDTLIKSAPHEGAVAIPSEAVIRSGQRTLVVVSLGGGRFEPREVDLGLDTGEGWQEITSGLEVGESIVVSSHFLIDSESRLQEAVQKLLGDASAAKPEPEPEQPESDSAHEPMRQDMEHE